MKKRQSLDDFYNKCKLIAENCQSILDKIINQLLTENMSKKYIIHKYFAFKNELPWEIPHNLLVKLMLNSCNFCKSYEDELPQEIDLVDYNKGFIKDNVIASCSKCLIMRNIYIDFDEINNHLNPDEFIKACIHIATNHNLIKGKYFPNIFKSGRAEQFLTFKKRMIFNNVPFKISEEYYLDLILNKCYICGYQFNSCGLEMIVPRKGYIRDNLRTCCDTCKLMKSNMNLEDFITQCKEVAISFNQILEEDEDEVDNLENYPLDYFDEEDAIDLNIFDLDSLVKYGIESFQ